MKINIPIHFKTSDEIKESSEKEIDTIEKILILLKENLVYIIWITILSIILIYLWFYYKEYRENIIISDKAKLEFIKGKEKELAPLLKLRNETDNKINPIQTCIDWVKKTLGTKEYYNCNSSLIPKANADYFKPEIATYAWKIEEVKYTERDKILMERVCKYWKLKWKVSPLCNNWLLYSSLKWISEAYWISFSIALGITYAESHIWVNYAGWCNESYNNWWWIKWRIGNDWKAIKDQKIPQNNCYLYKFGSIEDYWQSKMKTLQKYASCFKQKQTIKCISYSYVGNPKVAEQGWINRVALIAN